MKFQIYKIGNRIAIKTIQKKYSKVTHFNFENAKKVFRKMNKYDWEIEFLDDSVKIIL